VARHEWLAGTVRIAKTSGMWEALVPGTSGADRPADEACGSGRVAGNRNNHLGVNNTAPSRARIQAVSHIRKATGKKHENSS